MAHRNSPPAMIYRQLMPNTSAAAAAALAAAATTSSPDEPLTKRGKLDPAEESISGGGKKQSSRKPRDSNKPNPLISSTEKCKVCLEPAAKHIHYGAVTCFSCRAFFRRSIQNRSSESYKCRKDNHCDITLKSRKSCQRCRFERCIEVRT